MSKDYEGYQNESTPKYISSKFEYDLFDEGDNIANLCVRIKRQTSPLERWRFYEDKKNTLVIESSEIDNNIVSYLRSVNGINFCVAKYKLLRLSIKDKKGLKNKLLQELAVVASTK